MIVCHCKALSDRVIRQQVRMGAKTCKQVGDACGAGTDCGGCRPTVAKLVRSEYPRKTLPIAG